MMREIVASHGIASYGIASCGKLYFVFSFQW